LSRSPVGLIWVLGVVGLGVAAPGASAAQDVDLGGVGYVLGSPEAPITVVELSDFGCWACALFHETTWPAIEREFVQTGRIQWRHIPFLFGLRHGEDGTKAAECAADQGQYWENHGKDRTRRATAELDVSGTPTFVINGSRALGALTIEVFRGLLEEVERGPNPGG